MNTMDDPEKYDSKSDELTQPASMEEGEHKFHKLGWKRLTICLIVEAIALGSLSLPSVFATLGMVPGILITVTIGLLAMYTSYIIGNVKLKYPHIKDYAEALGLIWGNFGYQLAGVMFFGLLIFAGRLSRLDWYDCFYQDCRQA